MRLHGPRAIERLTDPNKTAIGMKLDPEQIWEFVEPNCLERGNFHKVSSSRVTGSRAPNSLPTSIRGQVALGTRVPLLAAYQEPANHASRCSENFHGDGVSRRLRLRQLRDTIEVDVELASRAVE
jgi:hypothetical protein